MTPKDVKVNRNVMAAAEAIAGRRAGSVTARKAAGRDAPRTRAASSVCGSRPSHSPPTVRTTTAWLKNTWASTMASTVSCRSTPRGPWAPRSARNAAPTTTVGSTKGTVARACTNRRPRNS